MKPLFTTPKRIASSMYLSAAIAVAPFASADTAFVKTGLEEMVVTSQFRDASALDIATSVSVFNQSAIEARGASNLDELLNMAPNVNFSAGASRGRFLQIRGIGERSQFVDPVNPSVGLIVDGIDFTGLGLAASTLDVAQVEILRGPQGTHYGANALAGLINMSSNAPSDTPMAKISAELAQYNSQTVSMVVSGPLSERLKYRLAAQNQQSDGYTENDFLQRDDTSDLDESVVKAKLRFDASDDLQMDFSLLYIDADNGYDAFSLDNTRTTLSDQPGWDRQESVAASLHTIFSGANSFGVEIVISAVDSETEYGYDEDWVYQGFHPDGYSSTDNYARDRDNISADVRLVSKPDHNIFGGNSSWVAGVYLRNEEQGLVRNNNFESQFDTENYAAYGQLTTAINSSLDLVTGLRLENRQADYSDNLSVSSNNDEDLWGGSISLEYHYTDHAMVYGLISRGYKAGGVNGKIISAAASNSDISSSMFEFDTEYMLNFELGLKGAWLDSRLQAQVALFYQERSDVQAKQSIFDPNDFSFDDFLANAAGGNTTGLELDVNFKATESLRFFVALGLLDAEFDDYVSASHVDAKDDWNGLALAPVDLDGRDVAHAPSYQFFVGTEIALMSRLTLRLEAEGKDEFYFSNSHDEKSNSYELFNARLTYHADNWNVALWAKNLTDKDYYTRGFYFSNQFGNNPANGYAPESYYQFAAPRVAGISASYTF